jgi:hypothetical protein
MNMYNKNEVIHSSTDPLQYQIMPISKVEVFTDRMRSIRKAASCSKKSSSGGGLVPLYHYTSPAVAEMIMKGGLRMSSQGQGDGGVYVSTQGPASYGLGSDEYEVNIIKDCFGVERVNEYKGKGNLDIIIIYGCTAAVLEQTPGGRDNAKMVSKSAFENFSLKDVNENYFLRPDRILGVFQVNHSIHLEVNSSIENALEMERQSDLESVELLKEAGKSMSENIARIDRAVKLIRNSAGYGSSSFHKGIGALALEQSYIGMSSDDSSATVKSQLDLAQMRSMGDDDDDTVSSSGSKPPLKLKLESITSMPKSALVGKNSGSNLVSTIGTSLDG